GMLSMISWTRIARTRIARIDADYADGMFRMTAWTTRKSTRIARTRIARIDADYADGTSGMITKTTPL
ncbi:MAG: hypothetical protein WEE20_08030, partial [Bacteroidota bacterium]